MTDDTKHYLGFGFHFNELYSNEGLQKIDLAFIDFLNKELGDTCLNARKKGISYEEENYLLFTLAPYLEDFLAKLFRIQTQVQFLQEQTHAMAPILQVKRQFVQRFALKKYKKEDLEFIDIIKVSKQLAPFLNNDFSDLNFAKCVLSLQDDNQEILDLAAKYATWMTYNKKESVLFQVPEKLDFNNLIPNMVKEENTYRSINSHPRHGFKLTDSGLTLEKAISEANYCIWCHHQEKDSCSKGLKSRNSDQPFQKNHFDTVLTGCPLEEKISQMNELKSQGYTLVALAVIMIDNPLVAATGHRICNDCMKSCIYQKQEPVNIPGVETHILKSILNLPWGFEIYSLLSRWNPLNFKRPMPLPPTGYHVLVAGTGPAGFNLSHHLLNEGHTIVGIDGLKIEPLPPHLSGIDHKGNSHPLQPIIDINDIYEELDERIIGGFGGVAEYGITVRWDKNFLKIIRLLLERRKNFALFGGVRLGGTLSIQQIFDLGFDHIALCTGAGSPKIIEMENNLALGVRQASDFLMSLQLTGAAKYDSITNLQVDLPIIVIGGGLTAIDTATEALAYYQVQIKKFAKRYQQLELIYGKEYVRQRWNDEDHKLADIMLARAKELQNHPNPQELLNSWGGATVVYRKNLQQAPNYTLNHEEVAKALEEGIKIIDNAIPKKVLVDVNGNTEGLMVSINDKEIILPAKNILVAAGTRPNINLNLDMEQKFNLANNNGKITFQAIDEDGNNVTPPNINKSDNTQILMHKMYDKRMISFFGDLHPSFAGNVVKAMASAKKGYPIITRILSKKVPASNHSLLTELYEKLQATVHEVNILTPNIVEVVIHAPFSALAFHPGQFYRLQNFESLAQIVNGTRLTMEGIALTGAWVDKQKGLLSLIILEMGGSSKLCRLLKKGEPISLMGPTGAPTEIPHNKKVILVGGGLGNAVLFSIGKALKDNGCEILYFAGYKFKQDRYKIQEIEDSADQVVWCCDENPGFDPSREKDLSFVGNIVEAMTSYAQNKIGKQIFPLNQSDHMIVIGSDVMMNAVAKARHLQLKKFLHHYHKAIGSINSPMQCMMKGICAQCLQIHKDLLTGIETTVYSCINQDQNLDLVDFKCLKQRLSQNSLQEKLTNSWVNHILLQLIPSSYG